MSKIEEVIRGISWKLLRQQKFFLLSLTPDDRADGLIQLLDAIQDAAIEDGIATEREVFPYEYKVKEYSSIDDPDVPFQHFCVVRVDPLTHEVIDYASGINHENWRDAMDELLELEEKHDH